MGASSEQHYSLRWNDYTVKIVTAFQSLRDEEDFVDVTVACDGHHYSAHKMVLSACSPYFRSLLRANPCQHPIVILKDVGHIEMERLLEFMYNGEVNIAQDQLAAFLKTAEGLKIRGLAGSSEDLDQSHRDPHGYSSCLSGATGTIGGISGRNSPSVSFNSSQEGKDEDITTDGIFHTTNSPSTKRRKRSSGAPVASHADNSTSHTTDNLTGEGLIESGNDRGGNISGDTSIDLEEDSRMDRREMKSEPSDHLGEVYVESSDIGTDQSQHSEGIDHRSIVYPLALPGPSGSSLSGHDGLGPHENAAAPGGAVCEALNLSLRPTPAIPHQVNGSNSLPASVSIHHRPNIHRSLYQQPQHHLQSPSNTVTLIPTVHDEFSNEEELEFKVHPSIIGPVAVAATSDAQRYSEAAIDLVCAPDKKPFSQVQYHSGQVTVSLGESAVTMTQTGTPEYKTKIYPCPECLKVFRHPMSLHHHRHVHKGTYTCQSCGKVFSRRWDLHRHIHRSKMGCRRPNHTISTDSYGINSTMRPEHHHHPFDLNNPPSN